MKKQDDLAVCRSVRYTRGPRKGAVKCSQCGFFFVPDEQMYSLGNPEPYLTGIKWFFQFKCCPNCLPAEPNASLGSRRCLGKRGRGAWFKNIGCGLWFKITTKARKRNETTRRCRVQMCYTCNYLAPDRTGQDKIIEKILQLYNQLGRVPTIEDWQLFDDRPSIEIVRHRIGKWSTALDMAGIRTACRKPYHPYNKGHRKYTKKFVIDSMASIFDKYGKALTTREWDRLKIQPPSRWIMKYLNWNKCWSTVGATPNLCMKNQNADVMRKWLEYTKLSPYHPDNLSPTARQSWQQRREQEAKQLDRITQLAQESADAAQRWQEHKFKRKR